MKLKLKQIDQTGSVAGNIPVISNNNIVWSNSTTQPAVAQGFLSANGTAPLPALSFSSDNDTGLYLISNARLGISSGGVLKAFINTVSITTYVPIRAQSNSAPSFTFDGDTNTGLGCDGADTLQLYAGGVLGLSIKPTKTTVFGTGQLGIPSGTTTQRLSGVVGDIRYNTEQNNIEAYHDSGWKSLTPFNYNYVTSSYSIQSSDYCIGVGGDTAVTLTLPSGVTRMNFVIKDETGNASVNNITVIPSDGQTIDGKSSYIIDTNFNSITIYCGHNSNWFVI